MADQLPPEQDESLIDMATRYGQGVMRKHPVITRGLASIATDPLDLVQFLAMHGSEDGLVAPNQIETPEQMTARHNAASSIPNAGELAQKYLAQAGVRESETLPEQIGELGVGLVGPALLAKGPKAFSWGAKILGKTSPSKATALTTDAFHGTRYDFPAFVNNPNQVARGETNSKFILDQALGTHFAKDPKVSNTFVMDRAGEAIEGGSIIPAKIPDEKTFLEAKQDLLPYIKDRATPRGPSTVHSDQDTIEKMIAAEGYKLRPDLLTRYLVQDRKLPEDVAASISKRLAKGKSVRLKEFDVPDAVSGPPEFKFPIKGVKKSPWEIDKDKKVNLEQFLNNYGGKPHNVEDRAALVDTARKSWQDKGYTGLKYLNTSQRETEFAKDPTSYIVFDPKHTRSRFAQFNPADVESSDLLKSHGGPVHMGKGGLLKAGAEELVELAAKYLPKASKSDLPMDEASRMARADKDYPIEAYHASRDLPRLTSFSKEGASETGQIHGSSDLGFWFTNKPDDANYYSMEKGHTTNQSPGTLPARLSIKKPYTTDRVSFVNDLFDTTSMERQKNLKEIKDAGHDGIIIDMGNGVENYIVFEGSQARSRFAKFDPADKESSDLLKSHGGPIRKASGGLSRVNESGNYTKPGMRKQLFNSIKARAVQGTGAGQWSARKAQLLAKSYKEKGGGYKD
tara:strand:- start:332 stop:2377 length:2046 start_codon:yes stop_codon:yes gene_type:complete